MAQDNQAVSAGARQGTLREFLAVVFRRRWVIIGLFLATTVTVVGVVLTSKAEFVSTGRVLIRRGEKESVLTTVRRSMGAWEEDLASELEIIHSYPVLQRAREIVAEQVAAGQPPLKIVPRMVDAEVMGKSNVVAIAYADPNPEVAQRVCDALINAYVQYRRKDLTLSYPGKFFEGEIGSVSEALKRKTEERREYANREGIVDIAMQRGVLLSQRASLADRLDQLAAELSEARSAHRQMQELKDQQTVDLPTLSGVFTNEGALVDIKNRITLQEARVAQLRERYREDAPEVVAALSTLATFRDMLSREVNARLTMSQARIRSLEARQTVFERDLANIQAQIDGIPNKETRIDGLDREIALLKERLHDLVQRNDQARVIENTTLALDVVVLSPAGRARPRTSRDYGRLALAPAFSVLVGMGLAFFLDGLDLTVRTTGHAEEAAELPVFAALTERRRRAG
jgi:uncharacterized protein involved in exopolysaccharide biosynthesis